MFKKNKIIKIFILLILNIFFSVQIFATDACVKLEKQKVNLF
jgi:regulatory protein YycI of two-component signal transduction system YycFG